MTDTLSTQIASARQRHGMDTETQIERDARYRRGWWKYERKQLQMQRDERRKDLRWQLFKLRAWLWKARNRRSESLVGTRRFQLRAAMDRAED